MTTFTPNQRVLMDILSAGPANEDAVDLRSVSALETAEIVTEGARGYRLTRRGRRIQKTLSAKQRRHQRLVTVPVLAGCHA